MHRMSRRTFIGAAAAVGTAPFSPIGLFFPQRARATVPVGEFLRPLSHDRFWFGRVYQDLPKLYPNMPQPSIQALVSPAGQLTMKLGLSGGFSMGYFSTLSFLSDYRDKRPSHYRDLLFAVSQIPKNSDKRRTALRLLESHRKYASLPLVNRSADLSKFIQTKLQDRVRIQVAPRATDAVNPQLSKPLEQLQTNDVQRAFSYAIQNAQFSSERANYLAIAEASQPGPLWPVASAAVQKTAKAEFLYLNDSLEFDSETVNTQKLVTFDQTGNLTLSWVDPYLLHTSCGDGTDYGRLGAFGYVAVAETKNELNVREQQDANQRLKNYDAASRLIDTFQTDEFFQGGTDVAANRSAVRMRSVAQVTMPNNERRLIDFYSPFLPYDLPRTATPKEEGMFLQQSDTFLAAMRSGFSNVVNLLTKYPQSTVALDQGGAFVCCPSIHRDTLRLLAQTSLEFPELRDASLDSVVLVPEATSSWTFAGMGAALVQTHLVHLAEAGPHGGLKTFEERVTFKNGLLASISTSVAQALNANRSDAADSSLISPALAQYADGYRVSYLLGDRVADSAAQAQGAGLVYKSLQKALPEFFGDLPTGGFLTAEQISNAVGVIAVTVHDTIQALRLQVEQLTAALKDMTQFVQDLGKLIDDLKGDLSSISNSSALKDFQRRSSALIEGRMKQTMDAVKLQTLASLQGLINVFVVVGVNIETNIRATMKANAGYCGVGVNK